MYRSSKLCRLTCPLKPINCFLVCIRILFVTWIWHRCGLRYIGEPETIQQKFLRFLSVKCSFREPHSSYFPLLTLNTSSPNPGGTYFPSFRGGGGRDLIQKYKREHGHQKIKIENLCIRTMSIAIRFILFARNIDSPEFSSRFSFHLQGTKISILGVEHILSL